MTATAASIRRLAKIEFILKLRMSLLCKSFQYSCRSKILLRQHMRRQRSIPKERYQNLALAVRVFLQNT